ncbi:MAG: xylose isomerase [Armatimonadota bacterium]|nr:MAG: xylose isomerase [Armatimonadota bacterium]
MKLACQEGMAPGGTLQEKLDHLAQYGYEGIEFWGAQFIDADAGGMRKERVAEVRRLTENHPVKPSTICAGYRGALLDADRREREQAVQDIETLLYAAGEIGATGVIVVPIFGAPRIPDLTPYASAVQLETELLCKLLEPLSKVAEKAGSVILLEPLNRYETHYMNRLEQAVDICQRVGASHLKLMADFFHMSIEERDIPAAIRSAKGYLAHVHLADSTRLLPGYGHTDFRSGFAALKEIGFDRYMALECGIPGDPREELPKCAQYLRAQMP